MKKKLILGLAILSSFTNVYAISPPDPGTPINLLVANYVQPSLSVSYSSGGNNCILPSSTTSVSNGQTTLSMKWNTASSSPCMNQPFQHPSSMTVTFTPGATGVFCKVIFNSCTPPSDYENQQTWKCNSVAPSGSGMACTLSKTDDDNYTITP